MPLQEALRCQQELQSVMTQHCLPLISSNSANCGSQFYFSTLSSATNSSRQYTYVYCPEPSLNYDGVGFPNSKNDGNSHF